LVFYLKKSISPKIQVTIQPVQNLELMERETLPPPGLPQIRQGILDANQNLDIEFGGGVSAAGGTEGVGFGAP
jgi:hypothetical protein